MSDRGAGGGVRVAAVGGGHGLSRTLEALLRLPVSPTAVVTVADDGGSSGRLRREHGILALGDMRMALQTLAADGAWADLFGHRFGDGDLDGHALGNLALLALVERHGGDVVAALRQAAALLGCRGAVLPCTLADVTLVARIDEDEVRGQVAVATARGRRSAVWLEPQHPDGCPDAVAALADADAVVLGPGSLFTSIIPNLLVPAVGRAAAAPDRPIVYVANLTSQPGETGGMDLQDHVEALLAHLPGTAPITVVAHDGPTAEGSGDPIGLALDHPRVAGVVGVDLATRRPDGTPIAAHDPDALAAALGPLLLTADRGGAATGARGL